MSRVLDAEYALIGGVVIVPEAYWRVADLIQAEDFSRADFSAIWRTLEDMIKRREPVDVVTFAERNPQLADTVYNLNANTASAANIRAYAEFVSRAAVIRRVRQSGQRIASLGGEDALEEAQRILASCSPRMASAIKPAREFLRESLSGLNARYAQQEALTGISTSIPELDELLSGWQRGDLIVIAARPSVGKTALALQASLEAALAKNPVLFLSLEMAGAQLTDRALAYLSGVDSQYLRQPKRMAEEDWTRITRATETISSLPLMIDETSALRVEDVGARVRQANSQNRLGIAVIDYLTQMTPPKAEKQADAIQGITRPLKSLAKELKIPVILLSQLNRGGEHAPTLTSLRESGAIEQDADVVILLHSPDSSRPEFICAEVAKQRNGPRGKVYLRFDGATGRFEATDERPAAATTTYRPRRRGMPSQLDRVSEACAE